MNDEKEWEKQKSDLFKEKAAIIALILSSKINGFEVADPALDIQKRNKGLRFELNKFKNLPASH